MPQKKAMNEDRCPDCGATGIGGRAGCQALLDEIAAQAYSDSRYGAVYGVGFDAYCMQHPPSYCRSAKSYAAHLTRLCCWLEHGGNRKILQAIPRWLNGTIALERPEPPSFRGPMTVADVQRARNVEEHIKLVRDWAKCVWEAYAAQHDIARKWIEAALSRVARKVQ